MIDSFSLKVIEAEQTFGVDYDYYYFKLRGSFFLSMQNKKKFIED